MRKERFSFQNQIFSENVFLNLFPNTFPTNLFLELTQVLHVVIEVDDMYLFLETLHVISDTYYDFGELDNSLFAFNQLVIRKGHKILIF